MVNRARVAEAMQVEPENLLTLHQVHSATVVEAVRGGWEDRPQADALVTAEPGLAVSVLTADCAPVLFVDHEAGVIGAAHAGWKGALSGVLGAVLERMEALGARREHIVAAVGPVISQRNYEVGEDFFERFADEDLEFTRFFTNGVAEGKYLFDLPRFVLARLRSAGVGDAAWIGVCTYDEPERFYSYRRTTHEGAPDYGRLISAIVLPEG